MFKTDKASLERLSFRLDIQDIPKLRMYLEMMKTFDLSTLSPEEHARLDKGLVDIIGLKTNRQVYAFSVTDEYAAKQGDGAGWGIELYLRQGDRLEEFMVHPNRDYVLKMSHALDKLKRHEITQIFTGEIPMGKSFLGLPRESDPKDPIERKPLEEAYIHNFKQEGINVVELGRLI